MQENLTPDANLVEGKTLHAKRECRAGKPNPRTNIKDTRNPKFNSVWMLLGGKPETQQTSVASEILVLKQDSDSEWTILSPYGQVDRRCRMVNRQPRKKVMENRLL